MRFVVSCQQGETTYALPAYSFWRTYFKNGIEEAGHDFVEVEDVDWVRGMALPDAGAVADWRGETWERTVRFIRREHRIRPIHLFLSYFFPQQIETMAIKEI